MTTTDQQTQDPAVGAESAADGQTVPGQGIGTPDPQNGSDSPKGNREARYRVERNEARAERDALAQRIEQLQTRELERIASKSISNPADLLTLSGKSLTDFIGDDGELDNELITDAADELLGTRPGLRPNQRAVDPSQGLGGQQGRGPVGWEALFQR